MKIFFDEFYATQKRGNIRNQLLSDSESLFYLCALVFTSSYQKRILLQVICIFNRCHSKGLKDDMVAVVNVSFVRILYA